MEISAGKMDVLLSGSSDWLQISGGDSFYVPANSKFKLVVTEVADYCCSYIQE